MIWREGGKIYVLDDPDTTYNFIYGYTTTPPVISPTPQPPWLIIAILIIIAIIIIIIVALFKTGRIYIEEEPVEEKPKKKP